MNRWEVYASLQATAADLQFVDERRIIDLASVDRRVLLAHSCDPSVITMDCIIDQLVDGNTLASHEHVHVTCVEIENPAVS